MPSSVIGLLLALLVTAVMFGGAWLLIQEIIPALQRGEAMPLLRWAVVAIVGAILVYRLVGRYRRRKGARGGFD